MNKSELIVAAADSAEMSKADIGRALDAIIGTIRDAVASGEKVSITDFGSFERRSRAARTGRNPQTGEELPVPASKAPAFKPAKKFKDQVNV